MSTYAHSVFADSAHSSTSTKYAFIPTAQLLEGLKEHGWSILRAQQARVRDKSKDGYQLHMVTLRNRMLDHNLIAAPELVLLNSHLAGTAFKLFAGLNVFACMNGCLSATEEFGFFSRRHSGNAVRDVIEGSYEVVERVPQILRRTEEFSQIEMTRADELEFAGEASKLRWGVDEYGNTKSMVVPSNLLTSRRSADSQPTLWKTYQRVQENLMRGGNHGRTATGRWTTSRAVKAIPATIKINRGLWKLTEEWAARKGA